MATAPETSIVTDGVHPFSLPRLHFSQFWRGAPHRPKGSPPFEGGDTEPGLCDLAPKTCDAVLCAKCTTDYWPLHALARKGKFKAESPALLPLGAFRQSILEPRSARENGSSG